MNSLQKRIISSIVYGTLWLIAVYFERGAVTVWVGILMIQALVEFFQMCNKPFNQFFITGLTAAGVYVYAFTHAGQWQDYLWPITIICLILEGIWILDFFVNTKSGLRLLPPFIAALLYLLPPMLVLMLSLEAFEAINKYFILFLLIGVWVNDIGAFAIGRSFGRNKLSPTISPGKTIEGFAGGLLLTIIFGYISMQYFDRGILLLIFAALISVSATMGDLVESKLKRSCRIKNSGSVMPGHGGILDRIDGFMFAAPLIVFYVLITSI